MRAFSVLFTLLYNGPTNSKTRPGGKAGQQFLQQEMRRGLLYACLYGYAQN
jgi:hypothetical protein